MPISGSIKARGIYEVLAHAEKLALEAGLLTLYDDYSKLLSPEIKDPQPIQHCCGLNRKSGVINRHYERPHWL
ncbi:hypothetical protein ACLK1U_13500 [Escherichia coli]